MKFPHFKQKWVIPRELNETTCAETSPKTGEPGDVPEFGMYPPGPTFHQHHVIPASDSVHPVNLHESFCELVFYQQGFLFGADRKGTNEFYNRILGRPPRRQEVRIPVLVHSFLQAVLFRHPDVKSFFFAHGYVDCVHFILMQDLISYVWAVDGLGRVFDVVTWLYFV